VLRKICYGLILVGATVGIALVVLVTVNARISFWVGVSAVEWVIVSLALIVAHRAGPGGSVVGGVLLLFITVWLQFTFLAFSQSPHCSMFATDLLTPFLLAMSPMVVYQLFVPFLISGIAAFVVVRFGHVRPLQDRSIAVIALLAAVALITVVGFRYGAGGCGPVI
jgi:hypothetical protein